MKAIITTLFLLVYYSHSFAQYSRSFFTDENESRRMSSILEIGGEIHFFSIRNSDPATLKIVYGKLDDEGETSDYQTADLPASMGNNFVLSGIAQQNNIVTMVIQGETGIITRLSYAQLDLSTNSITNFETLPANYKKGFSRSRKDGNNLITYQIPENGGLVRISTPILAISNSTYETVNITETANANLLSNFKNIELQIENGIECLVIRQKLIRRISSGNYSEIAISNFFPIGSSSIVLNSSNQVVLFQADKYAVFDQSLNPISSGTMIGAPSIGGNQRFFESYEVNSGYRIFHGSQNMHLTELDANFNIVNSEKFIDFNAFGVSRIGPAVYVFGQRVNQPLSISASGTLFSIQPSSMAVIKDYLNATPSPFIEYLQSINAGNFSVMLGNLGNGFANQALLEPSLKYKMNGRERTLLYFAADFFVGFDANDSLIGFKNYYNIDGNLTPGPYTDAISYDNESIDLYNRGYYVTQQMITDHAANIASGNQNYSVPFAIKAWPAHGDISKGQAANLAPFIDLNSNGIYEPLLGDYPEIYGSHCVLGIFHQSSFSPNTSQTETHYYTFWFECDTSEALKNTIFTRSHVFARGQNITDCYAGKFYDFDIGNALDDYLGTHVDLGLVYAYNGDNYDENSNFSMGFNDTIPAFGVMTLKGAKRPSDGIDNGYGIGPGESVNGIGFGDGIADNEFSTLESSFFLNPSSNQFPTSLSEIYNVGMGLNPDGSPNLAQGTTPTRFTYFGDSDPLFYATDGIALTTSYTESNDGNSPGERYSFSATGKSDLPIGDTLILIEAYIAAVDSINTGNTALYCVNALFDRATEIKNFFEAGNIGCGFNFNPTTLELPEAELPTVEMYPNPTNSSLTINLLNGSEMTIEVRDLNGRLVLPTVNSSDSAVVDFSALDNATYLVIVSNGSGRKVARIMKY